jgi:hypothetical protein
MTEEVVRILRRRRWGNEIEKKTNGGEKVRGRKK